MVKKEHKTETYFNSKDKDFFYMSYKKLFTASHWVDPITNEEVKLSHNIKAVYTHKLDQYKSFNRKGMEYKESHQRVADLLGISLRVVEEVAIPLLKRMGLIVITKRGRCDYITTMFDLSCLNGVLINKKIDKHLKTKAKKEYNTPITYDDLKVIEKNKSKIEKIKKDIKTEYFILTKEELDRLRKRGLNSL